MKILIVDDSTAMRMIVKKTLRLAGFEGHEISRGRRRRQGAGRDQGIEARSRALRLEHAQHDGYAVAGGAHRRGIKLTFGFITTEATPDMRAKAMGAGAKFLISKPFTPESFKEHLSAHIR